MLNVIYLIPLIFKTCYLQLWKQIRDLKENYNKQVNSNTADCGYKAVSLVTCHSLKLPSGLKEIQRSEIMGSGMISGLFQISCYVTVVILTLMLVPYG